MADLQSALFDPEPMCLVLVELSAGPGAHDGTGAWPDGRVEDEAQRRLRDTLRDYDQLIVLAPNRLALVLRTLADASMLSGRMTTVYDLLTRPYALDGGPVVPEVSLGAAVRQPQESSTQLFGRVEQALLDARHTPHRRAVMASFE